MKTLRLRTIVRDKKYPESVKILGVTQAIRQRHCRECHCAILKGEYHFYKIVPYSIYCKTSIPHVMVDFMKPFRINYCVDCAPKYLLETQKYLREKLSTVQELLDNVGNLREKYQVEVRKMIYKL